MIGRTLSHYRIVGQLGSGGMGTVYRGEDLVLGRPVALKFPHTDLVRDPAARASFLREARASSALDHPNIVVLYDICETEGEIFLAMQYVEGATLRERLSAGPLPEREALAVGRAVADALAHAHERGVIHRDVKPENVLVCPDGRVKVADFGIARMLADAEATRTVGVVTGTPHYLAPELLRGDAAGPRSDLYSLGVLLFELLAGFPPYRADHQAALLERVLRGDPSPLPGSVRPGVRRLVERLIDRDPTRRPASAASVSGALLAESDGARAGTSRPAEDVPARSIAILPFENLTGSAEEDYFAAGIREDLLTEILKVPDLKVASPSLTASLRGTHVDPRSAARELGVATVLEGGVRRAGARVRVTARLVRGQDGSPVWAERYDRGLEDIFEVQEDIARRIAGALRVTFEPGRDEVRLGRRTKSPKAYDLRLRALALHNRLDESDMREAIRIFEEALREDPDYALARADLAECCIQMVCKGWDRDPAWLDRAEADARRALALAPSLPEAFRALGHISNHRGKLEQALRDYHYAVDLDPRFASALMQLGSTYLMLGDPTRAEIYMRRGRDLEPENPRYSIGIATVLRRQGRYADAIPILRAILGLDISRYMILTTFDELLQSLAGKGDLEGVRATAGELRERMGGTDHPYTRAALAFAATVVGEPDEARRLLPGDSEMSGTHLGAWVMLARAHAVLGNAARAQAAIRSALAIGYLDLDEVRTDPWIRWPADQPLRLEATLRRDH